MKKILLLVIFLAMAPIAQADNTINQVESAVNIAQLQEQLAELLLRADSNRANVLFSGSNLSTANTLAQNYPNPFNPSTTIQFQLAHTSDISVKVYNATGQLVKTLAEGVYSSGVHDVVWDGSNDKDEPVSSGVYFYQLTIKSIRDSYSDIKSMNLLK